MAKINKQAVIQKLVDELNLYPGKDLIPTELADKILAVYQINAGEVLIKQPTATVVKGVSGTATTTKIYDVPATGKFYLTNVSLSSWYKQNAGEVMNDVWVEVTIDGVAEKILLNGLYGVLGGADQFTQSNSLNLQNPVLLDAGTDINLKLTEAYYMSGSASIVGYTED